MIRPTFTDNIISQLEDELDEMHRIDGLLDGVIDAVKALAEDVTDPTELVNFALVLKDVRGDYLVVAMEQVQNEIGDLHEEGDIEATQAEISMTKFRQAGV